MKFRRDDRVFQLIFLPVFFVLFLVAAPVPVEAQTQKEGIDRGMREKLIEPSIPNEELRSADKFWEEEERFILIGDVQAYGSYSEVDSDDEWGGSFYGLIAPAYKVRDRMMFILMYDGQYDRRMDLYSDDYGYRKRTEFQRHAVTPMLRIDFGEGSRYSITPSFNYTSTWNKDEGQDDSWSQGLYNYRDVGGGLDFDMREAFGEYGEFKIGAQYYKRRYPNYTSLLDLSGALGDDAYEDEKDYHGLITKMAYRWVKDSGFSWLGEYSMFYKELDDKKVVNSIGVLDNSKEQEDYIHELDLKFWYFFDDIAGGLKAGLNLHCRIYDSNQNYVRWYSAVSWDVNTDYFNYRAYRITPNVSYMFELIPLTASLSYSYEKLDYTDRWASDSNSNFSYDDQWEVSHEVVIGFLFEYSEKISFRAQWEYLKNRSNNDDESVWIYDYSYYNYLIGAKYTF